MEIGPIPGIRGLAAVAPRQGELRAPAVFDIDAAVKPGEGGQQRNGRKAAGAEENEEDDVMLGGEEIEGSGARSVDYFA